MPINRLEFDTDLDLDVDFTVVINPIEFEGMYPSTDYEISTSLDGEPIVSLPRFDGRVRTMTWRNLPNKSPYSEMVSGLNSLKYLVSGCNINLRDLHGTSGNNEWIPIRIVDVKTAWKSAPGSQSSTNRLTYDFVQVDFVLRNEI